MGEAEQNADAYLKRAKAELEKEEKGKMKIFFGYVASVGKTYAMLCAAQREKRSDVDIVAGYIEPHARSETVKKVQGLETIPPIVMQMGRTAVKEMGIGGILTRRPQVVLIDEVAYTNANDSKHIKRYQDTEEILDAGTDVCATLNIQHVESVHDMVTATTGVAVGEWVPDKIFDKVAQIETIDIPPEGLIARLQAGKIYQKESVGRVLGNFFSVENLTALQEIALWWMADWLDREQGEALSGKVKGNATGHIMMHLSASPSNARVIRQAVRMAKAFHGKLTAFYVETSDDRQMGPENVRRLQENRKLAEKSGAKVATSFENDIVEQIAGYAKIARATKIVPGCSYNRQKLFFARGSMSEKLVGLVPKLEVFLIPDSYDKTYVKRKRRRRRAAGNMNGYKVLWDMGTVCLSLADTTAVSQLFQKCGFGEVNIIMVYVLSCILTALVSGYRSTGVPYGILAVLSFNFCLTESKGTFNVYNVGYPVTFLVSFALSVIVTILVRELKAVTRFNVEKAYRMGILPNTSQIFQRGSNREGIGRDMAKQIGTLLDKSACRLVGDLVEQEPLLYEIPGKKMVLTEQELAVASWAYKNNKGAGAGTSTLSGFRNLFLTIRSGEEIFDLVRIDMQEGLFMTLGESVMLTMLNENALAFEKYEIIPL